MHVRHFDLKPIAAEYVLMCISMGWHINMKCRILQLASRSHHCHRARHVCWNPLTAKFYPRTPTPVTKLVASSLLCKCGELTAAALRLGHKSYQRLLPLLMFQLVQHILLSHKSKDLESSLGAAGELAGFCRACCLLAHE